MEHSYCVSCSQLQYRESVETLSMKDMQYAWWRWEMRRNDWRENLRGKDHSGDVDVEESSMAM